MIQVQELTKRFDRFTALDCVNMQVERGSIYGLVGPNGAGKSTILRHITGIYRPNKGTVLVDGQPVYENEAIKARMVSIPDNLFFFTNDNMKDMKAFYRKIYPRFSEQRYERLREAFPTIDEKRPLVRLSKGMQKQAAFWLAISCMPEVIVLDEPVDGLDPVIRRQVWSLLMADVAEYGTTVLVSSHNLRELEDVCDHVGIMNHGQVVLERNLSQLQECICKLQLVLPRGVTELPRALQPLHHTVSGRVHTAIVRMSCEQALSLLETYDLDLAEAIPLSLEEIFVYELGGDEYGIKEILL